MSIFESFRILHKSMNDYIRIFLAKWYYRLFAYFFGIIILLFLYNIVFSIFQDFLINWKYNFLLISLINFLIIALPAFIIEQIRSGNSIKSFGLQIDKFFRHYFIKSLLYVIAPFIIIFIVGYYFQIIKPTNQSVSIYVFLQFLFVSFFAVMQEEIFFRGIILKYLNERYSAVSSILIVSILFAIMHIFNPYINLMSFIATILAGILFSIMYLQTQTLWYPFFYHFFWNVFSALLLGSPISGLSQYLFYFEMKTQSKFEQFLLGNQYGIESGLVTIIILTITSIIVVKKEQINPFSSSYNFKKLFKEDRFIINFKK